jgi:uncharacterized protein YhbP (UPF0306 family)
MKMTDTKRETKHSEIAKERAEVFKVIYGVSKMIDILDLFREDYKKVKNKSLSGVQKLYKDYSYAIFYMYNPSSIRNNLVKFKNIIKEEGGRYEAVALEAFTVDNVYVPLKKEDKTRKQELKQKVRRNESDSQNNDPQIVIDKIKELRQIITSKSYHIAKNQNEPQVRAYHLLAILGLATGRRATELLKTLKLSKRGERYYFEGLLKGNNKKIEGNIIELSYKEVQGYLRELRKFADTKELSESQVNSKYSRVFNNAIKRLLGYKNVKDLRHNYAVAGSQLFKRENETIEDTITRILGHREVFTSALNYA